MIVLLIILVYAGSEINQIKNQDKYEINKLMQVTMPIYIHYDGSKGWAGCKI